MSKQTENAGSCEHGMPIYIGCDDCTIGKLVDEINSLKEANAGLLKALKELRMWLPIAVELAGLDLETTEVEFEFEDGSSPKTISIRSSMDLANATIAKHGGATCQPASA